MLVPEVPELPAARPDLFDVTFCLHTVFQPLIFTNMVVLVGI